MPGKKHPEIRLEITGDGSHTLYVPSLNEHYHSVFGAITESEHIFIRAGLQSLPETMKEISILEVGFGTGLNALLTCIRASECNLMVRYVSIEKFPLPLEMTSQFNFPNEMSSHQSSFIFQKIHEASWNEWVEITPGFDLFKNQTDLKDYVAEQNIFDLVYFDAFGPDVQPEMWTADVFKNIYAGMKNGGILVTYSTKGDVKRNLKNAGFAIKKLPGPPGKREILRAMVTAR